MAGKARVHELAKELGTDSKTVLAKLKDLGEFVKSASSTVEAPVAAAASSAPAGGVRKIDSPEVKPVDLIDTAGSPVLKRLAPVLGVVFGFALLRRRFRRRRNK